MSTETLASKNTGRYDKIKFNLTKLDSKRSICVRTGETIYIHCIPDDLNSEQRIEIASIVSHGFWKSEWGGILPQEAIEPRRYEVDDKLILQIKDSKPEDTGFLTCSMILSTNELKTSSIMVNIYAVPKFGLEFPLLFRFTGSCLKKMKVIEGSSSVLQEILCGIQEPGKILHECQYEIGETACKSQSENSKDDNSYSYAELIVRKMPHSNFKSPPCQVDCMKMYYVQHINANLEQIVRAAKDFHSNLSNIGIISDFSPTKLLTMRQYFYICPAGFGVRTNCSARSDVCMPCYPGTYSDASMDFCEKCPVDSYQKYFGAESCSPCPNDRGTGTQTGSMHESYCYHVVESPSTRLLFNLAVILWSAVIIISCFFGIYAFLDCCCYAQEAESEVAIVTGEESLREGSEDEDVESNVTEVEWLSEVDLND